MKKLLFVIAGLVALGGLGYVGTWVSAQEGVKPTGGTAESKPTLKIGVVNITKVIKEFKKANVLGDKILLDAQKYETALKAEAEKLNAEKARISTMPETDPNKDAAVKRLREMANVNADREQAYQKDVRKRRDDMAVEINKDIQRIIDSLARHYTFEMVLTCPDVATKAEEGTLNDAMRRMTAPAAWIAWRHPGLDITDECVRWLNHYCPAPGGVEPAAATAPK